MALTARQRNNVILLSSIFFILILNLTDSFIRESEKFLPVFDTQHTLKQVEFLGLVWRLHDEVWQCNFTHIECTRHGNFWRELTAMPVSAPKEGLHQKFPIRFTLDQPQTMLTWYWYPEHALLQSHTNHWYKLPMLAQHKLHYFLEHQK